MIHIVLDSSVLINLLFVAIKFENFISKLKELLRQECAEIVLPKQIADKEITYKEQKKLLKKMLNDGIIKLIEVDQAEIEKKRRFHSFRLGHGEIAMSIVVKKYLKENKLAIGFTNEKFVVRKMEKEIPLLHGLWFYIRMFHYNIINKGDLEKLISVANEDMKIITKELENIKEKYLDKKSLLKEIINGFITSKVIERLLEN